MIIEYKENFIHLEFEDEDFRVGEDGRSSQQKFLSDLKRIIHEQDREYDTTARIWLVTDTDKNRAIIQVLNEHYFGGAKTPKKG